MLQDNQARRVAATPGRRLLRQQTQEFTGENVSGWRYNVGFEGVSGRGRKIAFEYPCVDRQSQDTERVNDFGGRIVGANTVTLLEEKWLLTTYVTAATLLAQIKQALPGCETVLMNNGVPFTDADYEALHLQAEQEHIRPWME